ncbi:MAG TPA: redoxin domain-containing protein [Caldilineae bacterium]|nr:redoxin domain-containing protein [Caldilineae bacterium]
MSETPKAEIGQPAPDFQLSDMEGRTHRLADYRGQIVILNFWSAECPISEAFDPYFNERCEEWTRRGIILLAIDSNSHYDDDEIRRVASERKLRFPILRDRGNVVADLYGALTTPHIFLIDRQGILRYRGAVDDRTFRKREPDVNYLEEALAAVLEDRPVPTPETQPFGCTIVRDIG